MIFDLINGRLDQILVFAKENNLEESFSQAFAKLEHYSDNGYDVKHFSDFAPLSMEFVITDNGQFVLNGGLIFNGIHDGYGSGGAPIFSVSLCQAKVTGWLIHT